MIMSSVASLKKTTRAVAEARIHATTGRKLPHLIHLTAGLLLILVVSAVSTAQVTENLSEPRSFTFTIAPNLPVFTFKLIPLIKPEDEFGNPQSTIRQIQVFRADSQAPLQNLSDCDLEEMEPPGSGADFFHADDFNFDGYKDIFLETWHGATGGNWGGCIWLYNPATGKFDHSAEFSNLSGFSLDPSTKTISTFGGGGMLGEIHDAKRYAIRNKRLVLIWSQHQDWDDSQRKLHCIVKELVRTEMVIVRDEWSDVDGKNPPCEP
jgi:hypothetical protein